MRILTTISLTLIFSNFFGQFTSTPCAAGPLPTACAANTINLTSSFTNSGITNPTTANGVGCSSVGSDLTAGRIYDYDGWFTTTADATGTVDVYAAIISGDPVIGLYSGPCGTPTLLSCDDDGGTGLDAYINQTGLTPGATYWVRVWDYNGGTGTYQVTTNSGTPPANDNCASATGLTLNAAPTSGTNYCATAAASDWNDCESNTENNVWYSFTTSVDGDITVNFSSIDCFGSGVGIDVSVFYGTCASFSSYGCTSVNAGSTGSISQFYGPAGTYYVMVDGNNSGGATALCDFSVDVDFIGCTANAGTNNSPAFITSCAGGAISGMTVGQAYTVTAGNGSCTSTASASFTNAAMLTTPAVPTISTSAATCSAAGASTITNYNAALTYTFSPAGPSAGAGGAISGMSNGTAYTVTANNGSCTTVASASFTNGAMLITPTANDLTRSVCEDILGSGTTSGVNLTGNNSAINSGAGLTFTWYTDNGLTTPVASPSNATVNNGDIFYVEVDNGNCTNTAQVTYSVTSTITLTDPQTEVCEDVLGGGTYSGFDLTSLNGSVYSGSGATTYNWFESDMSTAVATPTNITLSDGDQYYIEVADGNCSNSVMLTFTVNALPTVTSVPTLELCDEGSSQATFDLTSAQSGVNSTGPTYNWFTDSGLSSSIASPVNYSSGSTTVYIEVIDANSCSNNIGVDLLVNPLPTVVTTTIEECNTGSNQATFNLNAVESIVNGGTANSVLWYSDAALTTSITTPGTYLTNSTTVYAEVTDVNVCTNSTPITLTVNALPMAIDQNPAGICEDTPGAGSSTIDLTIYETSINSTGTVTINWFSDVNLTSPIVSSNSTTASDGDIFYAQVIENSTSCEDTAAVTITILAAPSSNDITPSICEDILGSGQTANVDLTANNTAINGGSGLTYNWFIDPTLVTSVPDETNATINNGDVFYVEVDNGNCVSVAQVTYSVTSTITLNDPTPAMCESTSGSGQTSNFDLTSLNTSVYTGGGSTVYNWLESDMTTSVATPNDVTISNGDQYYLEVVDGNCSNTIMITMTVNSLPTMSATSGLELCDDGTGNAQFDLTALESGINGTGPTYNWYSDVSLSNTIATPSTYSAGSSTVYLEVTDINSCSNNISVDLTVNALPTANTGSITLCDDGTGQATFDLTSLESSVNGGTANSVSWFNDQALTSSVSTPSSLTTASTSVYAEVTDATTSCVNSIDVTLTVTSLPTEPILSNDATYCDGSAMIDLTATGNGGTLTWFDDAAMTNVVGTGNSFSPINNLGSTTYYVTEDLGGCISNSSSVTVTINSNPIADFSATPTSGSPELLVNYTDNSTGAGLIYNWEFGDNNTSAIQNPSNTFTTAGSYTTVLTVTDLNGCTDSTSIIITVDGEPSVLIIPNIFSPNGDESNDVFNISGTNIISISGTIMNRWGQVVFEFDTLEAGWDGRTVSGLEASEGTYYYLINAEGGDGVIYNYQGPFELVR